MSRLSRSEHRLARWRRRLARAKARGCRRIERRRQRHLKALKDYGDEIARWQRRHPPAA